MKQKKIQLDNFSDLGVPLYLIGAKVPSLLRDVAPEGVRWVHPRPDKVEEKSTLLIADLPAEVNIKTTSLGQGVVRSASAYIRLVAVGGFE